MIFQIKVLCILYTNYESFNTIFIKIYLSNTYFQHIILLKSLADYTLFKDITKNFKFQNYDL